MKLRRFEIHQKINDIFKTNRKKTHYKSRHSRRPMANWAILSSISPIWIILKNVTGVDSYSQIVHSLIPMNLLLSLYYFSLYCHHPVTLQFLRLMWNVSMFRSSYLHHHRVLCSAKFHSYFQSKRRKKRTPNTPTISIWSNSLNKYYGFTNACNVH